MKGQLRRALITALKDQSAKSRKGVMAFLKGKAIQVAPLWITNGLAVTASKAVIEALAAQPGIDSIRLDGQILTSDAAAYSSAYTGAPEWNLDAIGAPQLWNLGHTGSGRVVALMDTGVDANHDDLAPRWRGGSNSWFDPNGEHATPYDGDGHGTRTWA